jgi:hypothetical protein
MLYKSTKTGKVYKGIDGAYVVVDRLGRVKIPIGNTGHSYNFISIEAFEHHLDQNKIGHFKASYEHLAQAFLDKEFT